MKKKIMITSRIRGRDKGTGVNKTTRVPNVISLRSVTPWRRVTCVMTMGSMCIIIYIYQLTNHGWFPVNCGPFLPSTPESIWRDALSAKTALTAPRPT
jgi:hypothetical protein